MAVVDSRKEGQGGGGGVVRCRFFGWVHTNNGRLLTRSLNHVCIKRPRRLHNLSEPGPIALCSVDTNWREHLVPHPAHCLSDPSPSFEVKPKRLSERWSVGCYSGAARAARDPAPCPGGPASRLRTRPLDIKPCPKWLCINHLQSVELQNPLSASTVIPGISFSIIAAIAIAIAVATHFSTVPILVCAGRYPCCRALVFGGTRATLSRCMFSDACAALALWFLLNIKQVLKEVHTAVAVTHMSTWLFA